MIYFYEGTPSYITENAKFVADIQAELNNPAPLFDSPRQDIYFYYTGDILRTQKDIDAFHRLATEYNGDVYCLIVNLNKSTIFYRNFKNQINTLAISTGQNEVSWLYEQHYKMRSPLAGFIINQVLTGKITPEQGKKLFEYMQRR